MEEIKQLKLRLDFKDYPADWRVRRVSADWNIEPLVLFDSGRPPRPAREADLHTQLAWRNTPAKAFHLVHWLDGVPKHIQFDNPLRLTFTAHVQPFEGGWLLGDNQDGLTRIFDKSGATVLRTLDLGDGSNHLQTTPDGHIWVGYFDEGVFGSGIGTNGLVCFDGDGKPVFKYSEFAIDHDLPPVDDCYALNVHNGLVWVCYYSDFPLVCLANFNCQHVWKDFGATNAFAVRGDQIVQFPAYGKAHLVSRELGSCTESIWKLVDNVGTDLSILAGDRSDRTRGLYVPFSVIARGPRVYVCTEAALFELP